MKYWLDGAEHTSLPTLERAQAYGDGCFETMLFQQGTCPLLPWHTKRLTLTASALGIEICSNTLAQAMLWLSQLQGAVRCKLSVVRKGAANGYAGGTASSILVTASDHNPDHWQLNACLGISSINLSSSSSVGGLKTLNRLDQVLAAQQLSTAYDELVCFDRRGRPADCVYHNLFLILDEAVYAHSLADCGVQGVMRSWVLEQLEGLGANTIITDNMPEIGLADAAFITNALNGIRQVTTLDDTHIDGSIIIKQLQELERDLRAW